MQQYGIIHLQNLEGNIMLSILTTHKQKDIRNLLVVMDMFVIFIVMMISCCCSWLVAQLCLTVCDPVDLSTPGFPVLHHLLELA